MIELLVLREAAFDKDYQAIGTARIPRLSYNTRAETHYGRIEGYVRQVSLLTLFLLLVVAQNSSADAPQITGRWQLDESISTDAADELKGIRKKKRFSANDKQGPRSGGVGDVAQSRYWQEANAGKEWHHTHELAHAGPLQRLLESKNLEVVVEGPGYLFVYADGYERPVVPNPGGRVFTASGDELVKSAIGFTLAFWEDKTLVMETRIKRGGKLIERMDLSADGTKLAVEITIDRRDWEWVAKVQRHFNRVN